MEEEEFVVVENDSLQILDDGLSKENENPDVGFLEDLDSYWEDVNDRLTISRAVSDSIVRGMVTAIESEAAEKIAQRDLELSRIKEKLLLYHVGSEEEIEAASKPCVMNDKACFDQVSLGSLKTEARKQLLMLVQELTDLRMYVHNNGVDSLTLDKMLDSLKTILETVLKRKNETELPSSWQQEHDIQREIESTVVTSFVLSLKDEYEQRLSEQEAEFGKSRSLLLGNTKEITVLRQELEAVRKSFLDHENGDNIEEGDRKRVEQLHRKMSGSHEESRCIGSAAESYEALKHLSHDDLINHFKTEMNKMKRDHDYAIQDITEQFFTFKRKYLNLKERGSFSPVGKDKELEALRKKIPFVISKLDKILMEDEKLVYEGKNKRRLDSLVLENRELKDSLSDHQKLIQKLESEVKDSHVEASIRKEVYECFLTESLEHSVMREALVEDLAKKEACKGKDEFEDSCVESFVMEECCGVVYKEALKEAHEKIVELSMDLTEKEGTLRSEMVEKERLREEVHRLGCLVKEKEDLVQTAGDNLAMERKKLEVASQHIKDLQSQVQQQRNEIQEKTEALRVVSAREIGERDGYETKISSLREELELVRESLEKTKDEEREIEEKLSATKAEKERLEKQVLSLDLVPAKLIKGFNNLESLIAEKTQTTNSRLKNIQSQLDNVSHQINGVKGKASTYKQRLEKKCSDLKIAEAEVDLLGDEVESLLDLLEKIYIALDHYSPVLKHYPGITEILKLVRRELTEESKRPSH